MKNNLIAICLILCMVLMTCSVSVFAAGDMPDSCSLTLEYTDEEAGALTGSTFRLYLIAEGHSGRYALTGDFSGKTADVEQANWGNGEDVENLADILSAYIADNAIAPVKTQTTDGQGRLTFTDLPLGLYLVLGDQMTKDGWIYTFQPILLWLPCGNPDGGLDYAPVCLPKHDKEPETPEIETIDITVVKVWVDDGDHPSSVTVQLFCDGAVYDEVTLNDKNNWTYTWEGLEEDHQWDVSEKEIPSGYTAKVTRKGNTFTITNTKKLPQTGQLWWPVPVLLGTGMFLLLLGWILSRFSRKKSLAKETLVEGGSDGKK